MLDTVVTNAENMHMSVRWVGDGWNIVRETDFFFFHDYSFCISLSLLICYRVMLHNLLLLLPVLFVFVFSALSRFLSLSPLCL
ncbi:hypothetical protein BDZ91DRAFT_348587 [Kalaharituber pfeilii]|nr:hypothetical protein BDZ91DRAFT_348587 [Kalaharituber pfeilii]